MKADPIESSRGDTSMASSIRRAVATVPSLYDAESLLRTVSRAFFFVYLASSAVLFSPAHFLSPNALTLNPCFLSSLCFPRFSSSSFPSPFLFSRSFYFYFIFFSPFRPASLSPGYSTIRPPADIKLHKQRDAPEGLFALQQIFSDCSRVAPVCTYVRYVCVARYPDVLLKFKGEQYSLLRAS